MLSEIINPEAAGDAILRQGFGRRNKGAETLATNDGARARSSGLAIDRARLVWERHGPLGVIASPLRPCPWRPDRRLIRTRALPSKGVAKMGFIARIRTFVRRMRARSARISPRQILRGVVIDVAGCDRPSNCPTTLPMPWDPPQLAWQRPHLSPQQRDEGSPPGCHWPRGLPSIVRSPVRPRQRHVDRIGLWCLTSAAQSRGGQTR